MTRKKLFLFMCGQLGIMCLARFLFQWVLKFSEQGALGTASGEPLFAPLLVGATLFGFRLFDGISDPLAGIGSDWWVRSGKKRESLLGIFCFLAPLGLVMVFLPDPSMSAWVRWSVLLIGLSLFFIGYTVYAIPYWSLVQDYSRGDRGVRRSLSNMLGLGLVLATIIGFVVSPILVDFLGYTLAALIFSAAALLLLLAPIYAAPEQKEPFEAAQQVTSLKRDLIHSFRNKRFFSLLAIIMGSQMSFTILTAAAPFVAVHVLAGRERDVSLLLGPLIGTALPMFLWAPRLSAKFGWHNMMSAAALFLFVLFCLSAFVGTAVVGSPTTTAMLLFAMKGPWISILLALEGEAIADCAQEAGGAVGIYFGVQNLLVKVLNGLAIFLTAVLIGLARDPWRGLAIRGTFIAAALLLLVGIIASRLLRPKA